MAILTFNSFTLTPLSSPFPSSYSSPVLAPVSRVHVKPIDLRPESLGAVRISTPFSVKKKDLVIVRAAADADGGVDGATSGEEGGSPPPSSEPESKKGEVSVAVEKLPLESKLKEREEQRLRMKLAKKIRLRRKRLKRKRRMRKKGRWPPSKMAKLKNV